MNELLGGFTPSQSINLSSPRLLGGLVIRTSM
nr:MAG TPA: hypothetical protein [Caudoviricetes sp.]